MKSLAAMITGTASRGARLAAGTLVPQVGGHRRERGVHELTHDLGEERTDEEDDPGADEVGQEAEDPVDHPLDRGEHLAQAEELEDRDETEHPDDEGPDGAQGRADARAVGARALQRRDLAEQLGEERLDDQPRPSLRDG